MTKSLSRRLFMKAAASAPVAAQEVSAKIGLGLAGNSIGNSALTGMGAVQAITPGDHASYIKGRIKELISGEADQVRRKELKSYSLMLDPDLGSLRSVSPSFARVAQIERQFERNRESELDSLQRQLSRFTGGLL